MGRCKKMLPHLSKEVCTPLHSIADLSNELPNRRHSRSASLSFHNSGGNFGHKKNVEITKPNANGRNPDCYKLDLDTGLGENLITSLRLLRVLYRFFHTDFPRKLYRHNIGWYNGAYIANFVISCCPFVFILQFTYL